MKVKVKCNNSPKGRVPFPKGAVKIFNDNILPTWHAQVFSSKDSWPDIDTHLNKLQLLWDLYIGEKHPLKIDKKMDVYHKVSYHHFFTYLLTLF
jgi:hypothetical protein